MSDDQETEHATAATTMQSESREALTSGLVRFGNKSVGTSAVELPLWKAAEPNRQQPRSGWWRAVLFFGWCATFGMAAAALLRIVCHDAAIPLIWLNAFTLYLYLPAYALLAIALWKRRWGWAAANLAIVACHMSWVVPDFAPAISYSPPANAMGEPTRPIRIFFANVAKDNPDYHQIIDEIASENPDVIVFAECFPYCADVLRASPVIAGYPYGTNLSEPYGSDVVVLSRIPVGRLQAIVSADRLNVLADVSIDSHPLRLFCVHSPRPNYEPPMGYADFWRRTQAIVAEQPEPLVLIGDFNATQNSHVYKQLTSNGLRSAHADRGRGYAVSWPNGMLPLPPIRIDQALLSSDVECLAVREGVGAGSDHKPLILDIRVHPANAARPTATP